MNVTIEQAYQEACLALGEAVVRERLLSAQKNAEANELRETITRLSPPSPEG